jgi:hypothetical protein
MRVSKAMRRLPALTLVFTLAAAGSASAQCRMCDPFLHCININMGGAMVCLEGPGSCALLVPCAAGRGRLPDMVGDADLTTWTLFDAGAAPLPARTMLRALAGSLSLGDDARLSLSGPFVRGAIADATLAHGRDYAIVLADAAGDGFALKRAAEGSQVRLEVREVRGDAPGALLASETLGEHDQLRVPVRVEGRDRVLVLQAASVDGGRTSTELARLRRALQAAGRTLPRRTEPLLRARAL